MRETRWPDETFQHYVMRVYQQRGYVQTSLELLALGICEEAGEVAAAVLDLNPDFKQKEGREPSMLYHELMDLLVYVCALANAAGYDLRI